MVDNLQMSWPKESAGCDVEVDELVKLSEIRKPCDSENMQNQIIFQSGHFISFIFSLTLVFFFFFFFRNDPAEGFICKNVDQSNKMCNDYRVRFSCHPPFCGGGRNTCNVKMLMQIGIHVLF